MDSQSQQNFQRRLQELDAEVQRNASASQNQSESSQKAPAGVTPSSPLQLLGQQLAVWFNHLPAVGKVVVAVISIILGLSLLNTVLNLVTTIVMLAIVVTVLYGLYRVFLGNSGRAG